MIGSNDALLVVDVQNDFLPGGSLAVAGGDEILEPVNRCVEAFDALGRAVVFTRDWHPENHRSFRGRGGPWPRHCVAGTEGARFAAGLRVPGAAFIVSKGVEPDDQGYSNFEGTGLAERLRALEVDRVFIAGLATDYCVKATARDALALGFETAILRDAVRAVDAEAGRRALEELREHGARLLSSSEVAARAARP